MIPVLIFATVGSALADGLTAAVKALGFDAKVVDPALFSPTRRDLNRGVIVDGSVPSAEAIRKAYTGARARVLVVPPGTATGAAGVAVRDFFNPPAVASTPAATAPPEDQPAPAAKPAKTDK